MPDFSQINHTMQAKHRYIPENEIAGQLASETESLEVPLLSTKRQDDKISENGSF